MVLSKFSFVIMIGSTLLLSGCGNSLSPMDSAQKDKFRTTLVHLASVSNALQTHGNNATRSMPFQTALNAMSAADAVKPSPSDASKAETAELRRKIAAALQDKSCAETSNAAQAVTGSELKGPLTMDIAGEHCPFSFHLAVNGTTNKKSMDLKFEIAYSVKDDAFRKLSDIDSIALSGSLVGTGSRKNGSFKLDLDGKVHSQTEKDLGVYLKADIAATEASATSQANAKGEVAFGIRYSAFTAELKIKGEVANGSPTQVHYLVNEQDVTATEFQTYLRDFEGLSLGGPGRA